MVPGITVEVVSFMAASPERKLLTAASVFR